MQQRNVAPSSADKSQNGDKSKTATHPSPSKNDQHTHARTHARTHAHSDTVHMTMFPRGSACVYSVYSVFTVTPYVPYDWLLCLDSFLYVIE